MSAEFLHEVDETLKEERMKTLWRRYRFPFFAVLAVLFIGLGAYEYRSYTTAQNTAEIANAYMAAVDMGNTAEAKTQLQEITAANHNMYSTLAAFRLAGLDAADGKFDAAAVKYSKIADGDTAPMMYRHLARVFQAQLILPENPDKVTVLMNDLRQSGTPFMPTVLELQGMAAEKTANKAAAVEIYTDLQSRSDLTSAQRERVRIALSRLGENN